MKNLITIQNDVSLLDTSIIIHCYICMLINMTWEKGRRMRRQEPNFNSGLLNFFVCIYTCLDSIFGFSLCYGFNKFMYRYLYDEVECKEFVVPDW